MSVKRNCTLKKRHTLVNYRYFYFKIVSLTFSVSLDFMHVKAYCINWTYSERQKKLYIKKKHTLVNYRYFYFKIVSLAFSVSLDFTHVKMYYVNWIYSKRQKKLYIKNIYIIFISKVFHCLI